jgi:phosphoglycerate kinase
MAGERYETSVGDSFMVWGWAEREGDSLRNIPSPKLSSLLTGRSAEAGPRTVAADAIGPSDRAFDIGERTRERFAAEIARARTLVWNGPVGRFETPPFDSGTRAIAEAVLKSGAYFVVGGGDSVAAISGLGFEGRHGHISTGGGAMLEFLSGLSLPGIEAISEKP